MKFTFILIYLSLISTDQSHGFKLPSPLEYYNYRRKISSITQEPSLPTSSQAELSRKDAELQRILKEWLIRNQEIVYRGLPTYFKILRKNIGPTTPTTELRLSRLSRLSFFKVILNHFEIELHLSTFQTLVLWGRI